MDRNEVGLLNCIHVEHMKTVGMVKLSKCKVLLYYEFCCVSKKMTSF